MAKLRRSTGRPAKSGKPAPAKAKTVKPAAKKTAKAPAKKKAPTRPAPGKAKTVKKTVPAKVARKAAPKAAHKGQPKKPAPGKAPAPKPGAAKAVPPPPPRSSYADAVATYERAMQALQAKRYRDAAQTLKTVISTYPEEKELLERAQLYLRVCERQLAPLDATPKTPEECVYAATLAINAGDTERAVALLNAALAQDADNDHAEYMLGVALTIRGDEAGAIAHLERAVALNPESRELIAKEPDLESLRQTDAIRALLSAPAPVRKEKDKRPAPRGRASAR